MPTHTKLFVVLLCIAGLTQTKANANPASASAQQSSITPMAEDKKSDSQTEPQPPRPNPDSHGIYHRGEGVTIPKLISSVEPEFSEKARKKKIGGDCEVSFVVRTDGTPTDLHVTKSIAGTVSKKERDASLTLDQNAVKAVAQYRFEPATLPWHTSPVRIEGRSELPNLLAQSHEPASPLRTQAVYLKFHICYFALTRRLCETQNCR